MDDAGKVRVNRVIRSGRWHGREPGAVKQQVKAPRDGISLSFTEKSPHQRRNRPIHFDSFQMARMNNAPRETNVYIVPTMRRRRELATPSPRLRPALAMRFLRPPEAHPECPFQGGPGLDPDEAPASRPVLRMTSRIVRLYMPRVSMEDDDARKSRLTRVAVRIGTAMGKTDRKVQKVAKAERWLEKSSIDNRSRLTLSNANCRKQRSASSVPQLVSCHFIARKGSRARSKNETREMPLIAKSILQGGCGPLGFEPMINDFSPPYIGYLVGSP